MTLSKAMGAELTLSILHSAFSAADIAVDALDLPFAALILPQWPIHLLLQVRLALILRRRGCEATDIRYPCPPRSNEMSSVSTKTVSFNVHGVMYVEDDGHTAPIEKEIRALSAALEAVKDEQEYIVTRERLHRDSKPPPSLAASQR